jgi:hypothetical protein
MTFQGVDAGGGEMFPQHPKTGEFESLKGRMLQPYEAEPWQGESINNPRPGTDTSMPDSPWTSEVIVNTGMTGGGGTMAH